MTPSAPTLDAVQLVLLLLFLCLQLLLVLNEPIVQDAPFLGTVEFPEVLLLSLVNDGENKGEGLIDSSDLGDLGPCTACNVGDLQLEELYLQVLQMSQQLSLLARKVQSTGLGHSWARGGHFDGFLGF